MVEKSREKSVILAFVRYLKLILKNILFDLRIKFHKWHIYSFIKITILCKTG